MEARIVRVSKYLYRVDGRHPKKGWITLAGPMPKIDAARMAAEVKTWQEKSV